MNLNIISKAYKNNHGFDLLEYHKQFFIKDFKKHLIDSINNRGIVFEDDTGGNFRLISYKRLLFITNDINCYPCGNIVEGSQGHIFTFVIIIPDGKKIFVENSIYNSGVVYNSEPLFDGFLNTFKGEKENFIQFIGDYRNSFFVNKWCDNRIYRFLVHMNKDLNINDKYDIFANDGLLNPLQLVISNFFYRNDISIDDILKFIITDNQIFRGIENFHTPKDQIKFANSTIEIIDIEMFRSFLSEFNEDDVDNFLNIYLFDSINFDKMEIEHLEIILNSHSKDLWDFNYNRDVYKEYIKKKLSEINLTIGFVEDFYKNLKLNILKLEDLIRKKYGFDSVGSLYSEKFLFESLKIQFPELKIKSQYSPKWLGRQRIDIFVVEINLAIEYNGKQHYYPIDFFGGEKGLKEIQLRDNVKKEKCLKNGVDLIEVRYDENIHNSFQYLKNLIETRL
jgi:hypothetical protein